MVGSEKAASANLPLGTIKQEPGAENYMDQAEDGVFTSLYRGPIKKEEVAKNCVLEVCVDSLDSALAALCGGADRIELCSALFQGGLTPTPAMYESVQKLVNRQIPVFCMVRPRGGSMIYGEMEEHLILNEIKDLKNRHCDGIVFGAVTSKGDVDEELCQKVIAACGDLPCTFHRAFDICRNPLKQLEVIINLGFKRILTSGCAPTAFAGAELMSKLVERSNGRITIMGGAGVNAENCVDILRRTGIREIHASAKVKKMIPSFNNSINMGVTDDSYVYVTSPGQVASIQKALRDYLEGE